MTEHKDKDKPDLGEHDHQFILDTDGGAWVSGTSSFSIPFRARPQMPKAWFADPPSCGPSHNPHDWCEAEAVNVGFFFRPRWFLKVTWHVASGDIRLLNWMTDN